MDQKLLAWGLRRKPAFPPRLWLFTDEHRLADPRASVARLPRGKAGVVLRHDHVSDRLELAHDLVRICRDRRLILVVAGDPRLAALLGAGVHLRAGRWPNPLRRGYHGPQCPGSLGHCRYSGFRRCWRAMVTSSAHSIPDLRRARLSGASLVFLSPAFPTASHAGAPALGPLRWAAMARCADHEAGTSRKTGNSTVLTAALGGLDGRSFRRLPAKFYQAIGAIGALSAD